METVIEKKSIESILVRLARAVACRSRLRILTIVVQMKETTPTAIAAQLTMRREGVSNHLKELMAVGLITRRASGAFYYVRAIPAYSLRTPSGRMAACLRESLSEINRTDAAEWDEAVEQVFALATAFTHARRLYLLSCLAHGERSTLDLMAHFGMSPPAFSGHCRKIVDRGFVVLKRKGRKITLRRRPPPTPLHRAFWSVFVQPENVPATSAY